MDMIGCARAVLIGYSEGGPTTTLFDRDGHSPPRGSDGVRLTPGLGRQLMPSVALLRVERTCCW
jgi:hypothetical protein